MEHTFSKQPQQTAHTFTTSESVGGGGMGVHKEHS